MMVTSIVIIAFFLCYSECFNDIDTLMNVIRRVEQTLEQQCDRQIYNMQLVENAEFRLRGIVEELTEKVKAHEDQLKKLQEERTGCQGNTFVPPEGFSCNAQGHCLQVAKEKKSWPAAKISCEENQAMLLPIYNIDMQNFLLENLKDVNSNEIWYWIGLYQSKSNPENYLWVSGKPLEGYSPFYSLEDEDKGLEGVGTDYCIASNTRTNKWHDLTCDREHYYICYKEAENIWTRVQSFEIKSNLIEELQKTVEKQSNTIAKLQENLASKFETTEKDSCSKGYFHCHESGSNICVRYKYTCDGDNNCPNKEDESLCKDGYTCDNSGRCIKVVTSYKTWSSAKQHCENEGAHLVVIKDGEFNKFVVDLSYSHTAGDGYVVWIGLSQYNSTSYRWVTGEPLGSYHPWDSAEQHDYHGEHVDDEDSILLGTGSETWYDGGDSWLRYFVCEK